MAYLAETLSLIASLVQFFLDVVVGRWLRTRREEVSAVESEAEGKSQSETAADEQSEEAAAIEGGGKRRGRKRRRRRRHRRHETELEDV